MENNTINTTLKTFTRYLNNNLKTITKILEENLELFSNLDNAKDVSLRYLSLWSLENEFIIPMNLEFVVKDTSKHNEYRALLVYELTKSIRISILINSKVEAFLKHYNSVISYSIKKNKIWSIVKSCNVHTIFLERN